MTTLPQLPGPQINQVVLDSSDELKPSLSDWHDYEPNLEFDDTELTHSPDLVQNTTLDDVGRLLSDSNTSAQEINESLEDDNYEKELPEINEYSEMDAYAKLKFFDFYGTDKQGQHIFAIYACRLPKKDTLNGSSFIEYIIKQMEPYVQNDYVIIYFHQGLNEDNKPSIPFLWNSYKELDKNFRKNLKKLYVVHPTFIIRVIWNVFKPIISSKFKNKLIYISNLEELHQSVGFRNVRLPENIYEFDEKTNKPGKTVLDGVSHTTEINTKSQFGVSLKFINKNSPCLNYIPPIVRDCVDSLSITGVIDTEGIFRRAGNYNELNDLKQKINKGESIDFKNINTHVLAGLLKSFLRDLEEPLLTYDLYDEIVNFLALPKEERSRNVKQMLREKLPIENYELFKYLIEFLVRVSDCKDLNKMTTSNLAIVFGPNLIWRKHNHVSLEEITPINAFIDFVLQNHRDIYMVNINQNDTVD